MVSGHLITTDAGRSNSCDCDGDFVFRHRRPADTDSEKFVLMNSDDPESVITAVSSDAATSMEDPEHWCRISAVTYTRQ